MKEFLILFTIFLLFPLDSFGQSNEIPQWVRNNASWWSDYKISDHDFVKGIEFLVQREIIKIPQTIQMNSNSIDTIPSWLRNNAGWWSQGLLSDDEFVKGVQYLVSKGIIHVPTSSFSCSGNELCIYAIVERIVDGDTIYVEGYKVRLSLVNTPENNERGFSEATELTKRMCPVGSIAIIDQDDKQPYDAHGRLLGVVYCDGKVLNSELLYEGHATILTQYCATSEFSQEPWAGQYGCADISNKQTLPQKTPEPDPVENANCDPSYPDVCIPPSPPDLDCKDVQHRNFRVLPPDPHRFDGDKDGIGCESK